MRTERIVWVVALLIVGGIAYFGGQTMGVRAGEQNRAAAAQQFFGQRGGQNRGQGGQGNFRGGGVAGTVSAVSGNTITVTTRNGQSVEVQLAADGKVRKQVDGQLSDITKGEEVIAFGAQNGNDFQATNIQIGGQFGPRNGQGAPSANAP